MPCEFVNCRCSQVQAVGFEAVFHCGDGGLQARADPAIGRAELWLARLHFFSIEKHKLGGIPEFVAKVLVAFYAAQVEANIPSGSRKRRERKTQRIGAIGIDALGKLFACRGFNSRSQMFLHESGRAFFQKPIEINAVNEVKRIEHIALGLGHFLSFGIANQSMDIDFAKRHVAHELDAHHYHPGYPEENNVETSDKHIARIKLRQ